MVRLKCQKSNLSDTNLNEFSSNAVYAALLYTEEGDLEVKMVIVASVQGYSGLCLV